MNAAKRKRQGDSQSEGISRLVPIPRGTLRTAILGAGIVALFIASSFYAWNRWGETILAGPEYVLTEGSFELVPTQPDWIRSDIRSDVIQSNKLDELSLLDPKLTVKVATAFSLNSWVRDVVHVTKQPGAKVSVRVDYREPVAMTEVVIQEQPGLLPVDAFGVLLPPEDFSVEQTRDYLRIGGFSTSPSGPVGTSWGDPRVAGAALIAAVLAKHWQALGLYRIELSARHTPGDMLGDWEYDLTTRNSSTRIPWGKAPQADNTPSLRLAAEKVARLIAHVESNGPLNAVEGSTIIDLSATPAPASSAVQEASSDSPQ